METPKVETKVSLLVLALAALFVFSMFAGAGNFGPPQPRPTMGRPFDRIHDAITSQNAEREGYCRTFVLPADSNQTIFTVPEGKRFVLLRLNSGADQPFFWHPMIESWNLTVDDELFLSDKIKHVETNPWQVNGYDIYKHVVDFPDRLVVVNAGETLGVTNTNTEESVKVSITIIGYFYDVK